MPGKEKFRADSFVMILMVSSQLACRGRKAGLKAIKTTISSATTASSSFILSLSIPYLKLSSPTLCLQKRAAKTLLFALWELFKQLRRYMISQRKRLLAMRESLLVPSLVIIGCRQVIVDYPLRRV